MTSPIPDSEIREIEAPMTGDEIEAAFAKLDNEFFNARELAKSKLRSELARLREENEKMGAVLQMAREHIDGEIDVSDGDYGEPRPNKAMQLASAIDEVMP